ncbi:MAG TPA: type II and III secretion system protein family protein [Stellaceae bacterium]|jgi:pilus assembly protein CpaC
MRRGSIASIAAFAVMAIALAVPALAADIVPDSGKSLPGDRIGLPVSAKAQSGISLEVSQGKLVVLPAPATNVFVADPAVADIQLANADHIFVFGKKSGRTTVYALGVDGILLRAITVDVSNPTGRAQQMTSLTPGSGDIHVGNTAQGLVLEGHAADADVAAKAQHAATENVPEKSVIDDRVKVRSSVQVTLRVRIAEVSRTVTKQLGINWTTAATLAANTASPFKFGLAFAPSSPVASIATLSGNVAPSFGGFGNANFNAVIDALSEEGLVTILAEPSLTAISGETASFLAGGEFPIPVSQALGVTTIDFKSFGVSLNFIPTVMASNHISLRVKPEVSQISNQGAININGLVIPALTVRRADTTIELGSGQSFIIAGLLQDNTSNDIQRFPGLGDLPVLGALFRSTSFQRNESELLIVVTPYIVRPIDDPKSIRYPTDAWQPATDIERVLIGVSSSPHLRGPAPGSPLPQSSNPPPHLVGDAGFEVE